MWVASALLSCPRNVNVQNSEGPNVFNERSEHIPPRGDTLLHTLHTSSLATIPIVTLRGAADASSMGPARVPAQVPRRGRGAARVYIFTALHVYIFTASCLQNIPRYINRGDGTEHRLAGWTRVHERSKHEGPERVQ